MATDTNSWYTVASLTSNSTRSMQWCTLEILCYSDTDITGINAHWQFAQLQSDNSTIITLRNRGKGPHSAIAVFSATNQTQPGFAALEFTDPAQQWYLSGVNSGSAAPWLFVNIANGTNYHLAERGNDPMYMSERSSLPSESEQWIPTRVSAIDDATWSWTASSNTTSLPTTATNTPIDTTQHHSGLKGGAIAGLVIGILAFVVLMLIGGYLVYRRRDSARKGRDMIGRNAAPQEKPTSQPDKTVQSISTKSPNGIPPVELSAHDNGIPELGH